jgi:hypothetical protein
LNDENRSQNGAAPALFFHIVVALASWSAKPSTGFCIPFPRILGRRIDIMGDSFSSSTGLFYSDGDKGSYGDGRMRDARRPKQSRQWQQLCDLDTPSLSIG